MKVLVTDASYIHTLAIIRYLGKQGIKACVISDTKIAVSFYSKYC